MVIIEWIYLFITIFIYFKNKMKRKKLYAFNFKNFKIFIKQKILKK